MLVTPLCCACMCCWCLQAALDKVLGSHDLMGAPLLVVANKQVHAHTGYCLSCC
jgi:hypothetical protein